METILVIFLGFLVGISSALLGLGGNIIIVPSLPLISQLELPSVIATGILTVFFVTLFNVINFYRQKLLDFKLVSLLIIPTSLSSYISSHYASLIPEKTIKTLFILVMILMLIKLIIPLKINLQKKYQKFIFVLAGLFSGTLAGLTGVGTGIILGPLLLSTQMTEDIKVSPTINFLIMISCFFSSLNYLSILNISFPQSGLVRLDYVLLILIPALITGIIGRKLNSNIKPRNRRIVVGLTLILLIAKTI